MRACAGETITLGSGILRSSAIELLGSGIGSLSQQEMREFYGRVLPEMFQLAAGRQLQLPTETVPLSSIAQAWNKPIEAGKRLVIRI